VTIDLRRGIVELLPRLRRFSYALTRDADKGDELVQEACARALAGLDQWRPGTRLDSWMFKIAHNIWRDHKRASKVRGTQVSVDDALELPGEDGRDVAESRLTLSRVLQAMAKLPENQQVLIALVCVDGLSYKDASAILGIPMGTVMSRLARARRTLYEMAGESLENVESER
jgi:RNA polymerase sigma-70 factor, ECF subfamily